MRARQIDLAHARVSAAFVVDPRCLREVERHESENDDHD